MLFSTAAAAAAKLFQLCPTLCDPIGTRWEYSHFIFIFFFSLTKDQTFIYFCLFITNPIFILLIFKFSWF